MIWSNNYFLIQYLRWRWSNRRRRKKMGGERKKEKDCSSTFSHSIDLTRS